MRSKIRGNIVVIVAIAAALLSGCAQPLRGPWYASAPVPPVDPDRATIYIVRTTSPWYGYPLNRYSIDGNDVAKLTDNEFTWLQVPPGGHRIEARGFGARDALELDSEAGEIYFLRFSLRNSDHGRFFGSPDASRIVRARFEQVDGDTAARFLARTTYSASEAPG